MQFRLFFFKPPLLQDNFFLFSLSEPEMVTCSARNYTADYTADVLVIHATAFLDNQLEYVKEWTEN